MIFSKSFLRPLDICRLSTRKLPKQATLLLGAYSRWHKGVPVTAEQQGRASPGAHPRTDLQHPHKTRTFVLGSVKNLTWGHVSKTGHPEVKVKVEMHPYLWLGEPQTCKGPLAVLRPLKEELTRLQTRGIIMLIETSTEWISSRKVVRKSSGKPRICSEPKTLSRECLEEVSIHCHLLETCYCDLFMVKLLVKSRTDSGMLS